jgi:hypothetical protein
LNAGWGLALDLSSLELTDWGDRSTDLATKRSTPTEGDGRTLDGHEDFWNAGGQKILEQHWKHALGGGSLLRRRIRWYGNGQIAEDANYDDHGNGTQQTWYRDGQPATLCDLRHRRREGAFMLWYSDGAKQCEAHYKNGRLDGVWQKWDAAGKLVKRVEYRNGDAVLATPAKKRQPFEYDGQLGARDFAFVLAEGRPGEGYYTLRVTASGRCEFHYFDWKVEFQLTDEMQRRLRDAIAGAQIFRLKDEYGSRAFDAYQWIVLLRAAGKEKRICCTHTFPSRIRTLSRTLRSEIILPHRIEILTATEAERGPIVAEQVAWLDDPSD